MRGGRVREQETETIPVIIEDDRMEDPGVVAGFSHTENLPVLVGGMALHDDYVWAPLIKTPDGH